MSTVAVFCGSSSGNDPGFGEAARSVGAHLARAGHRLVYGGGHVGLMGIVADAAIDAGGDVTGVITEQLFDLEVGHRGLTDLEVEIDMHARKARMAAMSDGVIVLPGGFGTLDEAFEILTWNQLGIVSVPVVFLDVHDYFAALFEFVGRAIDSGFMKPDHGALPQRTAEPADAVARAVGGAPAITPKWVDRRTTS
ncbi:MAG: TIGR00730 family Rossman fold protein [Actinomycetota bacterium]